MWKYTYRCPEEKDHPSRPFLHHWFHRDWKILEDHYTEEANLSNVWDEGAPTVYCDGERLVIRNPDKRRSSKVYDLMKVDSHGNRKDALQALKFLLVISQNEMLYNHREMIRDPFLMSEFYKTPRNTRLDPRPPHRPVVIKPKSKMNEWWTHTPWEDKLRTVFGHPSCVNKHRNHDWGYRFGGKCGLWKVEQVEDEEDEGAGRVADHLRNL